MTFAVDNRTLLLLALTGAGLLGIAFWGLGRLEARRARRIASFAEAGLLARLSPESRFAVRKVPAALALAALGFAWLALMQPQWGRTWQPVASEGRDVVVLLDTSESMRAADPAPSRLVRARQAITRLVGQCPADRFALVAFSGAAAVHCPLTTDHGYLLSVLDVLDTGVVSLEGTDIAAALRQAREVFADKQRSDPASQAVVLFSDGEVVSGDAEAEARALRPMADLSIVGIGSPEGGVVPPPEWLRGYERVFPSAQDRRSRLDETALERVAAAGGGVYLRSQPDGWDVDQIHERLMRMATRTGAREGLRERPVNRYAWPLGAAFACMAAEGLWLAASPWVQRRRMQRASDAAATAEETG